MTDSATVTVTTAPADPAGEAVALAAGAAAANAQHAQAEAAEAQATAEAAQRTAEAALARPAEPTLSADEIRSMVALAVAEALASSQEESESDPDPADVEEVAVPTSANLPATGEPGTEPAARRGHPLIRMFLGRPG